MSKANSIERINLIVSYLRKKPASFKEVYNFLNLHSSENGFDYTISQRTFKRDLDLIAYLLKIDIEYSPKTRCYEIIAEQQDDLNIRILESYDIFNALKLTEDISQFIHFENRKATGVHHMTSIINAIKKKKCIEINYHKYWDKTPTLRKISPIAIKENNNRWYVLAIDNNDKRLKTFGFDRIIKLSTVDFEYNAPKQFDVNDYFKHSFGIITDEDFPAEIVTISATTHHSKYLRSLPLHHTQKVVSEDSKTCTFELKISPTEDFIMELLSMGEQIKVLEPLWLKNELINRLKQTLKQYENK